MEIKIQNPNPGPSPCPRKAYSALHVIYNIWILKPVSGLSVMVT